MRPRSPTACADEYLGTESNDYASTHDAMWTRDFGFISATLFSACLAEPPPDYRGYRNPPRLGPDGKGPTGVCEIDGETTYFLIIIGYFVGAPLVALLLTWVMTCPCWRKKGARTTASADDDATSDARLCYYMVTRFASRKWRVVRFLYNFVFIFFTFGVVWVFVYIEKYSSVVKFGKHPDLLVTSILPLVPSMYAFVMSGSPLFRPLPSSAALPPDGALNRVLRALRAALAGKAEGGGRLLSGEAKRLSRTKPLPYLQLSVSVVTSVSFRGMRVPLVWLRVRPDGTASRRALQAVLYEKEIACRLIAACFEYGCTPPPSSPARRSSRSRRRGRRRGRRSEAGLRRPTSGSRAGAR